MGLLLKPWRRLVLDREVGSLYGRDVYTAQDFISSGFLLGKSSESKGVLSEHKCA